MKRESRVRQRFFSFRKVNDNWATPRSLYDELDKEFHFDFDPCPINAATLRSSDGLGDWAGTNIFVNPPYSDCVPWIRKAIEEQSKGKTVVMLLKSDTSTYWFHYFVLPNAEIRFIEGRLRFSPVFRGPAPFASLIAVFRGKKAKLE